MLAVLALLVLAVVYLVAPGHRASPKAATHLVLTATAGGLKLTHGGKPIQAAVSSSLVEEFLAKNAPGTVGGVYASTAAVTEGVAIVGSAAGQFSDALRQAQQYASVQVQTAAANGIQVGAPGKAMPYPSGPRGGSVACATSFLAAEGIPVAICAWVDSATNGFAVSNNLRPAELAAELAKMRIDMEQA